MTLLGCCQCVICETLCDDYNLGRVPRWVPQALVSRFDDLKFDHILRSRLFGKVKLAVADSGQVL